MTEVCFVCVYVGACVRVCVLIKSAFHRSLTMVFALINSSEKFHSFNDWYDSADSLSLSRWRAGRGSSLLS